jgi:peptidoglycan/LPS O-acetylase OafA/YrhL
MAEVSIARRHIPEFDGLRGIAALAVVADHLSQNYIVFAHGKLLHVALVLSQFGVAGVDVFFALSGFLITSILLEKRGTPHYYRNFYMRRVLRLAPAYLLTLALVGLLVPHSGPYLLLSLVYLANMAPLFHVAMTYGLLWSLSVEEHFYLLWPWMVRFLRLRGLAAACVLLCLTTPAARVATSLHGPLNAMYSWYRFDGLAWGALLALLVHSRFAAVWTRRFSWAVGLGGCLLCLATLVLIKEQHRDAGIALLFSAAAMLSTGVIGFAELHEQLPALGWLRLWPLRRLGDISYWLYLTHYLALGAGLLFLERFARSSLVQAGWGIMLAGLAFTLVPTIATGVLVRRWIELPVLRLKSRFR